MVSNSNSKSSTSFLSFNHRISQLEQGLQQQEEKDTQAILYDKLGQLQQVFESSPSDDNHNTPNNPTSAGINRRHAANMNDNKNDDCMDGDGDDTSTNEKGIILNIHQLVDALEQHYHLIQEEQQMQLGYQDDDDNQSGQLSIPTHVIKEDDTSVASSVNTEIPPVEEEEEEEEEEEDDMDAHPLLHCTEEDVKGRREVFKVQEEGKEVDNGIAEEEALAKMLQVYDTLMSQSNAGRVSSALMLELQGRLNPKVWLYQLGLLGENGERNNSALLVGKEAWSTALQKALETEATFTGNPVMQQIVGNTYFEGIGVPMDYPKAFTWYELAANQGDAQAQYDLGRMYFDGVGVSQDRNQAAEWFQLASNQGHVQALYDLGQMFHYGRGIPSSYKKAREFYHMAANQGHPKAQYNLGLMFANGQGGPKDYKKAFECYQLASHQGDSDSQYNLGWLYEKGKGVSQDYNQAMEFYLLAANQANAKAQVRMGDMYDNGHLVPKNSALAAEWYQVAANQNDAEGQYNLGQMYEDGRGVQQDPIKAAECHQLAAEQGHAGSRGSLFGLDCLQFWSVVGSPVSYICGIICLPVAYISCMICFSIFYISRMIYLPKIMHWLCRFLVVNRFCRMMYLPLSYICQMIHWEKIICGLSILLGIPLALLGLSLYLCLFVIPSYIITKIIQLLAACQSTTKFQQMLDAFRFGPSCDGLVQQADNPFHGTVAASTSTDDVSHL